MHQVGESVASLKVGDRVFVAGTSTNSGSYAQFVVSDATYVFPLHERLTFAQVGNGALKRSFSSDIFHRFESLSQMLRDTFKSVFLKLSTYFWNIDHCFTPKILKSIHFKRYIKYIFIRVHLWAFPSSRLIRLWSCEHVQGQARSFLSMAPRELWEHQLCRLLGKSKAYTDWIIDGIFLVLDPPRTA